MKQTRCALTASPLKLIAFLLAQVDRSAYVTATIGLRGQKIQSVTQWIRERKVEVKNENGEDNATVTLAPGAVSIIELKFRK